MPHPLPASAELDQFKRQAKQLLKAYRENPSTTAERIARHCPDDLGSNFKLADAQRVIAREYGFESWTQLKRYLESRTPAQRIIDAAANGETDAIRSLLDSDATLLDARGGWQQYRPLFFALRSGHDEAAALLRQRGASLDVFEAAALGDVDELRSLLDAAPKLANARREHYDATPLHAVRDSGVDAARLLLERGAHVNAVDNDQQRWMPLHGRSEHGDLPMVNLLLEYGADVHAVSHMGTPLHAAVGGFQHKPPATWRDVGERLLHARADVNADMAAMGQPGWTPLHHAAWRGHCEAVRWLLAHGADPTRINQHGHTPRQTADLFGHDAIVELLDAKEATTQSVDTLISLIQQGDYDQAMAVLNACPALATAHSEKPGQMLGESPLHRAAHRNAVELCERLIELGANVNDSATQWWLTPLAWAADAGSADGVDLLLRSGADVNQDAVAGTTALHAVAMGGSSGGKRDPVSYERTAELLIAYGADVNRRASGGRGRTPLDDAIAQANDRVAAVLRKHGAQATNPEG